MIPILKIYSDDQVYRETLSEPPPMLLAVNVTSYTMDVHDALVVPVGDSDGRLAAPITGTQTFAQRTDYFAAAAVANANSPVKKS